MWQVAVLAPQRRDVADLNDRIRGRLIRDGVLSRRSIKVTTSEGPIDYRKGDQVIVTRNHHQLGLLNGTRGTVRSLRLDGLLVQLTDGRRIALDKAWLAGGDLDHGYAMTLHKAQGRTVRTSLVLGDQTLSREVGCVGLSRGTDSNHLYLDSAEEHALRDGRPPTVAEDPTGLPWPERCATAPGTTSLSASPVTVTPTTAARLTPAWKVLNDDAARGHPQCCVARYPPAGERRGAAHR